MNIQSNCDYCGDTGLVSVYHRLFSGSRIAAVSGSDSNGECFDRMVPAAVAAHCVCPIGRTIRSRTDQELVRRIPDLQDTLDWISGWFLDRPDVGPTDTIRSIAELREFCRFVRFQGVGTRVADIKGNANVSA